MQTKQLRKTTLRKSSKCQLLRLKPTVKESLVFVEIFVLPKEIVCQRTSSIVFIKLNEIKLYCSQ